MRNSSAENTVFIIKNVEYLVRKKRTNFLNKKSMRFSLRSFFTDFYKILFTIMSEESLIGRK